LSQLYAQLRSDPLIKAEKLVRQVVYAFRDVLGDTDDMVNKPEDIAPTLENPGEKPPVANVAGQVVKEGARATMADKGVGRDY
jgi:hypothetical protein